MVNEMTEGRKTHWENIYQTKGATALSWYQEHPDKSLELIARSRIFKSDSIIDVGGGASTLVDNLIDRNYLDVTVLDISGLALRHAQKRLKEKSNKASWIEGDILEANLPRKHFGLWHDRAVFHFLTNRADRRIYVDKMKRSLKPGGYIIIASFSLEGPSRCSGLDIVRYNPDTLHKEISDDVELIESLTEDHQTPFDTQQKFIFCLFKTN